MVFNFLMQMLSPTLNYSLTTRLHGGKAACKRSMAWLQQDLLSTRCEVKKNRFSAAKKRRENHHFGASFSQSGMQIAEQKSASVQNPSHAWPSQKGMAIGQNIGLSHSPKLRRKAVFFFRRKKCGIFHALRRTYLKNRSKIGFSVAFPFWKKEEKKRKKELGLVFNL